MAPPRPGWSRRAQYGLFFSFLAVIAGLIIGVFLLGLSLVAPRTFRRFAARRSMSPRRSAAPHEVTSTVGGLFSGAGNYWDAAHQNAKLKVERTEDAAADDRGQGDLQENRQLKAALQLRERSREAVAAGRIVGSSLSSPRRFAVLSVGTGDGVQVGMPVRSPDGLIGRDHRRRPARLARTADFRPLEHRTGADPARRATGHLAGTRRRDRRPEAAGSRPQPVQARRYRHHVRHRRALSAAGAGRPGRPPRRRRRDRGAARRPRQHQLRGRRSAVRARSAGGRAAPA